MPHPPAFDPLSNPYVVESGRIVGRNRPFFNNRPLYGDHRPAVVLAGDRPHVRFGCKPNMYGCLTLAVQRGAATLWLHEAGDVTSRYASGRMEWEVRDPLLAGLTILWDVAPLAESEGLAARVTARGALPGDRLIWAFGGATAPGDISKLFDPVVLNQSDKNAGPLPSVLRKRFQPEECSGNRIRLDAGRFVLTTAGVVRNVIGRCTAGEIRISDASLWERPADLAGGAEGALPLACGSAELQDAVPVLWAVEAVGEGILASPACDDPAAALARACDRAARLGRQITLQTPDPRLNAGAAAACYAMDSLFYPPVYVHGAMAWNIPFPGWRSFYGATAFGWHANVMAEARYYMASQNRDTAPRVAVPAPVRRLCTQASESRFHGRGRITQDAGPYNFQTQFFDQLIHAWRWTGDRDLETLLRDALALHMEWVQDCFDPDNDGLYESYINTWPTDSVWCNGGGAAEETAYAFAGYAALAELTRRAGDEAAARRHEAQAEKIRAALCDQLWLDRKGYVAQYKEQGGLRRVHEDSWLGAIFIPIETGLLDRSRAAQALHYTEWGLERVRMPFGGSRCWMSNWVPAPWSVREMYPGDNYALALAYFRAGLADEGWDILQGNYLESMYYGVVPGGLACSNGGTDFADVVSTFCRTVVEGLFGYMPDYPNHVVHVAPQFPRAWQHASMSTPDVSIRFEAAAGVQRWKVVLGRHASLRLTVPVAAREILSVEANGKAVRWSAEPGFGCSLVRVDLAECREADVVVMFQPCSGPAAEATGMRCAAGAPVRFESPDPVREVLDPQGALAGARIEGGSLVAQAAANPGHHLVMVRVETGRLAQWRLLKIRIDDPPGEAAAAARHVRGVPSGAAWDCCDIGAALNADVREIYRQEYLSPRPQTCSVRIGVDGYSPWTFAYWKSPVPVIDLGRVPELVDAGGTLRTPQGVPFAWPGGPRNIAFASLWDNWPREVAVPVGRAGEAIWFLLCGTTNPMQCRIANARLRMLYADGVAEDLDLVPPLNFWTLCPLGGADYDYGRDAFALPATPPQTVQLGANCRAVLLNARLRPGVELSRVTLEALSQEVVIGLMGATVMR